MINYYAACDDLGYLEYDKLLEDILAETEQNIDTYRCFFDDRSITQLRFQIHDYVWNKNYDSIFGDLIPLITANLLNANIKIIVIAIGDDYRFAFFGLATKFWLKFQGLFLLVYGLLTLVFSCKTGLM